MNIDELININRHTAELLWTVTSSAKAPTEPLPHIIFPVRRSGAIRVSEQEARHIYCAILEKTRFSYALEAPTTQTYIQTGSTPLSARTDLAIYELDNASPARTVNIEFKAHNTSTYQIKKDIEKLVRERLTGNWFHLLSSSNTNTLPSLFEKFANAFAECAEYATHGLDIVFCFCVLNPKRLYLKRFLYHQNNGEFEDYVKRFFGNTRDWIA